MPFIIQGKTNFNFLLIIIILAVMVGAGALWYAERPEQPYQPAEIQKTEKKSTQEQGCINSGGTVSTSSCCKSSGDFPNSCLIGACGCSPDNSHQVKVCDCGEGKCFDGEKCSPVETPKTSLFQESFSYLYPLSWQENGINFDLTGVSLGQTPAPLRLKNSSGGYYKEGEKVYALTLILKIKSPKTSISCVSMNLRREINELGDMASPNNEQFYFPDTSGCMPKKDVTYFDQGVIFVVSETEKAFTLTTGGNSNIFFTVTLLENGHLKVEKIETGGQG